MEAFVTRFHMRFPHVPLIGGTASRAKGREMGEVLPAAAQVVLLLVETGGFVLDAGNFHGSVGLRCEIVARTSRCIERIRMTLSGEWRDAVVFYREQQRRFGVAHEDFESIAFTDWTGRNIRCFVAGGNLRTGANLPLDKHLMLSVATRPTVTEALASFLAVENALVFASSGLRNFVERPLGCGVGTVASFTAGEVCPLPTGPVYGNLMVVRMRKMQKV